ncbi:uncharacterized protein LOC114078336 isoform X1 [Solanum pennellii]|uniref:Uncharacterized protein LOC114078336 isoform X1 n=1 Tax=Solanum pennellii TaxID=28526 RepID=A0ABM1VG95_SOLPN|nr:uncharacterized protein LOC114078336 isoform X1 [Solanum pennellii]
MITRMAFYGVRWIMAFYGVRCCFSACRSPSTSYQRCRACISLFLRQGWMDHTRNRDKQRGRGRGTVPARERGMIVEQEPKPQLDEILLQSLGPGPTQPSPTQASSLNHYVMGT